MIPPQISNSLRCDTYYDAASQEIVKVSTDKLKIWLEDCQVELLKKRCKFFNSFSNLVAILGIFITLITTLSVTNFISELWKAIYIVTSAAVLFIIVVMGISCIRAYRKRNPDKLSDCIIKKIKENSIISQGEDG